MVMTCIRKIHVICIKMNFIKDPHFVTSLLSKGTTMKSILLLISIFSISAQAKIYNFIPCSQKPYVAQEVRELLSEPQRPGYAHHVGYYEFKKQGHVVGYMPFYYDRNQLKLGFIYACTNEGTFNYYNDEEPLKNWTPNFGQTLTLKATFFHDEAVSNLILTRKSQLEISIDIFIRTFDGKGDIIKDIITLSLVPKYKL